MKPGYVLLIGFVLGVGVTQIASHLREAGPQRSVSNGYTGKDTKVVVPLRSNELSVGAPAAPVTIIEYSDFQCPYCAMFRNQTFPKIKTKYIDAEQVRFIHRDLPLPFHSQAALAARAAACAGDQGQYWQFSDLMFSRPSCLECQGVMELSKTIALDRRRFEQCVDSNPHKARINEDVASAKQLKFEGTPSFVIGRSTKAGVEGVAVVGALPFEEFAAKIDQFIGKTNTARR
jgi:protein-disulfide isomerase